MSKGINSKIQELKESPLFALTLSGKELAHSNFWEWLINLKTNGKNPFVEAFIGDFYKNGYTFIKVKREEGNRDISIWYYDKNNKEKCFVVENKIKSIPEMNQLDKYKNELGNSFGGGVLTGIEGTLALTGTNWKFISYEKLAQRFQKILDKHFINNPNYSIVIQYIKDIKNISEVVKDKLISTQGMYDLPNDQALEELEKIRFADVFLKLKAEKLKQHLDHYLNKQVSKWGEPEVECTFHNKKPTISIIYKQLDSEDEKGRLGIQLEGDQYRYIGGPSYSQPLYNKEVLLYNDLLSKNWFEQQPSQSKMLFGHQTKMKKDYCKYKTKDYLHMYQYWIIEPKDKDYKTIMAQINKDLIEAKRIIDSGF